MSVLHDEEEQSRNRTAGATLVCLAILLSFAFGWTARGDHIYSSMFQNTVNITTIGESP